MSSTSATKKTGKAAKVLAAAEELVLKQGFKGVMMAAVAQRVGTVLRASARSL